MDKKKLENDIKKNYQDIQNYLEWDPWAEWFLDSLADLQTNFADYLIETLKEKKYGKDDIVKSNIYQWYIRWWKYKYINNEKIEHIISNKVLWKKISIDALVDEWIQKINDLFDTQKSFEEALEQWKIKSVQLNGIILPPDDLPAPVTWSGNWFERKELSQNKLLLFVSALREFWIYLDDLIIYTWKKDENMMRESSYYAIFIPRENKTVFLNTWYGEATFVCDWEVSIKDMTTFWKEKLQSELWAIKIRFFEQDVEWWKNELKNAILWNNWKVWKKIEKKQIKEIVNRIKRIIELDNFKRFCSEHKDDVFTDKNWNKALIKDLFKSISYYKMNYEIIKDMYNLNLPSNPPVIYKIRRNEFLSYLWITLNREIQTKFMSLKDLKHFYAKHKKEKFIDSEWNEAQIKDLFKTNPYYINNYKRINAKYNINLPWHPSTIYKMRRNDLLKQLGIEVTREPQLGIMIIKLDDLKRFYSEHKDDSFIDSEWNEFQFKNLFKWISYYQNNYKKYKNYFNLNLPSDPSFSYKMKRNEFLKYLGIDLNFEKPIDIISLEELKLFYYAHKNDIRYDEKWNEIQISDVFNFYSLYKKNYKKFNFKYNLNLPSDPPRSYKMKRNEFLNYLGISLNHEMQVGTIMSLKDLKHFYAKHKKRKFIDSDWNEVQIKNLFKTQKYYKKNYKIVNRDYNINLPGDFYTYYKITLNHLKLFLWIQ